ncbi:MAG: hypothetical protein H7A32_01005 [Deltaproteobacteria bacterium]|nr:hypothetical protein [Deltaproteobacteria bacterium]
MSKKATRIFASKKYSKKNIQRQFKKFLFISSQLVLLSSLACGEAVDLSSSNLSSSDQCQPLSRVVVAAKPEVMLVVDKSGSMQYNFWDHDLDPMTEEVTRWNGLHGALEKTLQNYSDKVNFGLQLFPSLKAEQKYSELGCLVEDDPEVLPSSSNEGDILEVLPDSGSQEIYGGTPAARALDNAMYALLASNIHSKKAVIFISDGVANCDSEAVNNFERFEVYNDVVHDIAEDSFVEDKIPTYIVGIDISKEMTEVDQDGQPDAVVPFQKFNELAVQGGRAKSGEEKFYQSHNQFDIEDALDEIVDDILDCSVELNADLLDKRSLKVFIGEESFSQVHDCNQEDGWTYTNENHDRIQLCGFACESFQKEGSAQLDMSCE